MSDTNIHTLNFHNPSKENDMFTNAASHSPPTAIPAAMNIDDSLHQSATDSFTLEKNSLPPLGVKHDYWINSNHVEILAAKIQNISPQNQYTILETTDDSGEIIAHGTSSGYGGNTSGGNTGSYTGGNNTGGQGQDPNRGNDGGEASPPVEYMESAPDQMLMANSQ